MLAARTWRRVGLNTRSHFTWYKSKQELEELLERCPSAVPVAEPYSYVKDRGYGDDLSYCHRSARKYSSFGSHADWWEYIERCEREGIQQLFNEVLPSYAPRCLYFDLDGDVCHKGSHDFNVELLQAALRSFLLGDQWPLTDPEPVVLQSQQETKYSCHVMFPQIQFSDFRHQQEYLPLFLRSLRQVVCRVEGGEERLLQRLVDGAVYKPFQLLRGPYACKMDEKGNVIGSSKFEPETVFRNDELTTFAGYVRPDYALPLRSVDEILSQHEALLQEDEQELPRWSQDPALYSSEFRWNSRRQGFLDLAGLTKLERYEVLLEHLDESRSDDWNSWWYISGVTCHMMQAYDFSDEDQARIFRAHCRWSSQSWKFDEMENLERIHQALHAPRLPSLRGLVRLVRHDNPQMQVREELWSFRIPRRQTMST